MKPIDLQPLREFFDDLQAERFEQARARLRDGAFGLADAATGHASGLAGIIEWYGNARQGHFAQGLLEAVEAISELQHLEASVVPAWLLSSAGFCMGVVGNVETGLQWIDQALERARASGDRDLIRLSLSNRGVVLQMAGELERGERELTAALAFCTPGSAGPHGAALNNLAFARLNCARKLEPSDPRREAFLQAALEAARQALSLAGQQGGERARAWALGNAGSALLLLGRPDEAAAAFEEALPLAPVNQRVHAVLRVGQAELLTAQGRHAQARTLLDEAWQQAPTDLLDSTLDLVLEARVKLELMAGEPAEAVLWSERRLRRLEAQHQQRRVNALEQAARLALLQREREQAQRRARQSERESLLQDLHDGFGSQLATARLAAERGELSQPQLVELLHDCVSDLYLVVDTLNNDEGRLDEALEQLRHRLRRRLQDHGPVIDWVLDLQGAPGLPHDRLVQALRVVQEALVNAVKHAHARRIEVAARYDAEVGFKVSVSDDGAGLPEPPAEGRGLRGMRLRATRLGGDLRLEAAAPGTRVVLRFEG